MSEAKDNRQWVLTRYPDGVPTKDDFELRAGARPTPGEGEFLVKNHWLSVDPFHRGLMKEGTAMTVPLNYPLFGGGVGSVVETNDPEEFPVGTLVAGMWGWQEYAVGKKTVLKDGPGMGLTQVYKVHGPDKHPISYAQGILGMPGATAYFGMFRAIGDLRKDKTLFVTGAAGAVGSIVGQIGKIEGLKVYGSAGTQAKVDFLKSIGFDDAFVYKGKSADEIDTEIKRIAPDGIDYFFENTGGAVSQAVIRAMNMNGKIAVCGQIASYNDSSTIQENVIPLMIALHKRLKVQGFTGWENTRQWPEAMEYFSKHITNGNIKVEETITEGFENAADAFIGLFSGENIGKQMVHISDP